MAALPLAHTKPTYCRHLADDCNCPEFEYQAPGDEGSLFAECELCEHSLWLHLARRELQVEEAIRIREDGGEPLEYCKRKGCGCPTWAGGEKDCLACGCKKGWHRWKDVSGLERRSPSVQSPMQSLGSPTSFSSGSGSYIPSPSQHFPQATVVRQGSLSVVGHVNPPSTSAHTADASSTWSPSGSSPSRSMSFVTANRPPHLELYPAVDSQLTFGSPSRSLVAPPLPPPPRPPTPPRHYLSTSPEVASPIRTAIDKGKAVEPHPIVEVRRSSPPRPTLQVRTSPSIPIPVSPPRDHSISYPPRAEDEVIHRSHQPPPFPADTMSLRTIATVSTSGSRYEYEDEVEDTFDLAVGDIDLGDGGGGIGGGSSQPVTWGGARVREPDEIAQLTPAQEVARTVCGISESLGSAGHGVGRLSGYSSVGGAVAYPSSSTPPSSPPQVSRSHSLRNPFARHTLRSNSQSNSRPPTSSPRDPPPPALSSSTHRLVDSQLASMTTEGRNRGASIASQGSESFSTHSGPASISEESATTAATSFGGGAVVERVMTNRSFEPISQTPKTYESKNLQLQISPALDAGRFGPGQKFELRLALGPKVSLDSFEKIDVKLIGNSYVWPGEPSDNHDFLVLTSSILPLSSDVREIGLGQRTFAWTMTLPEKQACDCRHPHEPFGIPSSYTHQHFRTSYRVELVAKKTGRLAKSEKISEMLAVHSPLPDPIIRTTSKLKANPMEEGRDGPWLTSVSHKEISVEGQNSKIIASELAFQLLPSTSPGLCRIPYRVTLTFDSRTSGSDYLNHAVLAKLEASFSLSLSRRIVFYHAGKKDKDKEEELPALKVAFQEKEKEPGKVIVDKDRTSKWQYSGVIEVSRHEGRSLVTCNVSVRYMLTARAPTSCGMDKAIEVQARGLNLELLPLPISPTSPTPIPDSTSLNRRPSSHTSGSVASHGSSSATHYSFASAAQGAAQPPLALSSPPTASASAETPISFSHMAAASPSTSSSASSGPSFNFGATARRDTSTSNTLDLPTDYDELGVHDEPLPAFTPFPEDLEASEEG